MKNFIIIRLATKKKTQSLLDLSTRFDANNLALDLVSRVYSSVGSGLDGSIETVSLSLDLVSRSGLDGFIETFSLSKIILFKTFIFTTGGRHMFISFTALENFARCMLFWTIFSAAFGCSKLLKEIHALFQQLIQNKNLMISTLSNVKYFLPLMVPAEKFHFRCVAFDWMKINNYCRPMHVAPLFCENFLQQSKRNFF